MRAYIPYSTANPTGVRPWNFAFAGGLSGRRRMGFYLRADFPLPQATLPPKSLGWSGANRNIPMLSISQFSGKASYGEPAPVYQPLSGGLGLGPVVYRGEALPARISLPVNTPAPAPVGPIYSPVFPAPPSSTVPVPAPVGPVYGQPPVFSMPPSVPLVPVTPGTIAQQISPPPAAASVPAAQVAASAPSQTAAVTATTPASTPSWFTDPSQELITGIPNWGLLAAGAAVALLLMRRGR